MGIIICPRKHPQLWLWAKPKENAVQDSKEKQVMIQANSKFERDVDVGDKGLLQMHITVLSPVFGSSPATSTQGITLLAESGRT